MCSQVAMRVADEKGCLIGQDVGYAVRFDNCCDSQRTKIKVELHLYTISFSSIC